MPLLGVWPVVGGGLSAPVTIGSVYVPGKRTYREQCWESLMAAIRHWLTKDPDHRLVIMGDWNTSRDKLERRLVRARIPLHVMPVSGSGSTWHHPGKRMTGYRPHTGQHSSARQVCTS